VAQPRWFYDDELSRLRWEWAAAMRDSQVAPECGPGNGLAESAVPRPGRADDRGLAGWAPRPPDEA
jgi:hypothetical protein